MLKLCLTLNLQRDVKRLLLEVPIHHFFALSIYIGFTWEREKRRIRSIREKIAHLFDFPASKDGCIPSLNFLVYPFHH